MLCALHAVPWSLALLSSGVLVRMVHLLSAHHTLGSAHSLQSVGEPSDGTKRHGPAIQVQRRGAALQSCEPGAGGGSGGSRVFRRSHRCSHQTRPEDPALPAGKGCESRARSAEAAGALAAWQSSCRPHMRQTSPWLPCAYDLLSKSALDMKLVVLLAVAIGIHLPVLWWDYGLRVL